MFFREGLKEPVTLIPSEFLANVRQTLTRSSTLEAREIRISKNPEGTTTHIHRVERQMKCQLWGLGL